MGNLRLWNSKAKALINGVSVQHKLWVLENKEQR